MRRKRRLAVIVAAVLLSGFMPGAMTARAVDPPPPGDDYPAKLRDASPSSVRDPWGYPNRQCTSFIAWRLNRDGIDFEAQWQGLNGVSALFYDADSWDDAARKVGITVDTTPAVGSIAQWNGGEGGAFSDGHVSYVAGVNPDGSQLVEDYNWGSPDYHQRTVRAPRFLHFEHAFDNLEPITRLAGADRIATAIAISQTSYPSAQSAGAVVLANSTSFADALAGSPLATAKRAPLLLTPRDTLNSSVIGEMKRVLPAGGTVYLLGGDAALSQAVTDAVRANGFNAVRYGGDNRFGTAVIIASSGLGNPSLLLEANGLDYPDALSAGSAAAGRSGAVLLTNGKAQARETADYIAAHAGATRYAIGGIAAKADSRATAIGGSDRYETSVKVAQAFFSGSPSIAIASGQAFVDALAGAAQAGGASAPVILAPPAVPLPTVVASYLKDNKKVISSGWAYGGFVALSNGIVRSARTAIT